MIYLHFWFASFSPECKLLEKAQLCLTCLYTTALGQSLSFPALSTHHPPLLSPWPGQQASELLTTGWCAEQSVWSVKNIPSPPLTPPVQKGCHRQARLPSHNFPWFGCVCVLASSSSYSSYCFSC